LSWRHPMPRAGRIEFNRTTQFAWFGKKELGRFCVSLGQQVEVKPTWTPQLHPPVPCQLTKFGKLIVKARAIRMVQEEPVDYVLSEEPGHVAVQGAVGVFGELGHECRRIDLHLHIGGVYPELVEKMP